MLRTKLFSYVNYRTVDKLFKSTSTTEFEKKIEHYRNLNAVQSSSESKPKGWDEAKPYDSIPGPKELPIIGNKWRFMPKIGEYYGKDFVDVTRTLREQYGDIVNFKGLKPTHIVMLFNPEDFEMLARNEGVWPIRHNLPSFDYYRISKKDVYPVGLLTTQGEEWFKIRTVVNPILMLPKNISNYTDKMNLVGDELIDNIKYLAQQNKDGEMPEDFRNELYKWSLESVGVVTLDTHLGCLKRNVEPDSESQKMIYSAVQVFELMYKLDGLPSMWKYFSTPDWKEYVKVLDFLMETNTKHINGALDKLKKEGSGNDSDGEDKTRSILQQILKKDQNVAIALAVDMMLAGIDTTGRVLGAGLYFLAKNTEKQEILREEARNLLKTKDAPITKDTLSKASYLKAVVKEVTRLAPIGFGNARISTKDLVLSGYQIPRGTELLTTNLILCLDDKHFPKAKEFIPERWLSSAPVEISHKSANPFTHAPFGYGSRSCIGKRLANLELEIAFLKIIRNFKITWPHEDMTFATTTLYGIAKPLKIRVKDVPN